MSMNGIGRLNKAQMAASAEKKQMGLERSEAAIARIEQRAEEWYQHRLEKIEAEREAREAEQDGSFWGNLVGSITLGFGLGTIVGSQLGKAVGDACNDGDENTAREMERLSGIAEMNVDRAGDDVDDAKDVLEDAEHAANAVEKLNDKTRESRWQGSV